MSYLDTLEEIKGIVERTEEFNYAQRILLLDILGEKIQVENMSDDKFVAYYEDVTKSELNFNFKDTLGEAPYNSASAAAANCFSVVDRFDNLRSDHSLYPWLTNAIKFTDEIVLHYIQEVCGEAVTNHPDHGIERSRYIQINSKVYSAQVAGNNMNILFDERNKLEHRTKRDQVSGRQIIIVPDYTKTKKKIERLYPKALLSFLKAYTEFYGIA